MSKQSLNSHYSVNNQMIVVRSSELELNLKEVRVTLNKSKTLPLAVICVKDAAVDQDLLSVSKLNEVFAAMKFRYMALPTDKV